MYIVQSYPLAILFCFITMLCWGSWGNTQKLAGKTWRYELFYWDYVIGILLFSLVWALTVGSCGTEGRKFLPDLAQASWGNIGSAFVGGVVFNAANILLSAAIAVAGMAVAFPVGIGLALVLGVLINYIGSAKGDPVLLFGGVALVIVAIVLNGIAYKMISRGNPFGGIVAGNRPRIAGRIADVVLLPLCSRLNGPGQFCNSGRR